MPDETDNKSEYFEDHWNDGYTYPYQTSSYLSRTEKTLEGPIKIFMYDTCGTMGFVLSRDKFIEHAKTLPEYHMINIKDQYPAIITGGKTAIVGGIWEILPRTLTYLDSVTDHPLNFHREIITLSNNDRVYAYIMNRWKTPHKEEYILSGNWIQWKREERLRRKKLANSKESLTHNNIESNSTVDRKPLGTINSHYSSRSVVHVNTLSAADLRIMLRDNGHVVDDMSDEEVRVEAINRYGFWFSVENKNLV